MMVPSEPAVGGGGAITGLIAVHIVELVQSWKIVPSPATALMKLYSVFMLLMVSGFLPQARNLNTCTTFYSINPLRNTHLTG